MVALHQERRGGIPLQGLYSALESGLMWDDLVIALIIAQFTQQMYIEHKAI